MDIDIKKSNLLVDIYSFTYLQEEVMTLFSIS